MRLLVVGNLDSQVNTACDMARRKGAKVSNCQTISAALEHLRDGRGADLVLIEVSMDIKKLIDHLKEERIFITVAVYGVNAKSEDAVKAIKAGAKEFIPLPPDEELIAAVLEAISDENDNLIYKSEKMTKAVSLARQIAPSEANILLTGESGTGKEVIARFIHKHSKRVENNFISVNCAAIPDNLIESELFGHEKGAFTGAVARRVGKFEEANNGTLLLDEISEMDFKLQAKLLRAIQEREIDRVGGAKPVKVNIRIIATSNRNLQEEVKAGRFREDLFFRLNTINISLPPLKERKDDIEAFADYFMKKYSASNSVPEKKFSSGALKKLLTYHWPGNVRELENSIHRAVLLSQKNEVEEEAIVLDHEPKNEGSGEGASITSLVGRTMESVEKELILTTLDHCLGNRTHAANILGISIRTLRNKLKEYGNGGGDGISAA